MHIDHPSIIALGQSDLQGALGLSTEANWNQTLAEAEMGAVKAYDGEVFGGDRGIILDALLRRSGGHAHISGNYSGFVLGRNGRIAHQIGPLCADDPALAVELLLQALKGMSGPVFIDACDHQPLFVERLKAFGFKQQRSFLRMAKAARTLFGDPARMFALAGPELG